MMSGWMDYLLALMLGADGVIPQIIAILVFGATVWMLVDAIRRGEWLWVVFLILFPVINTVLYFIFVFWPNRGGAANPMAGFELPGAADRRRIKQLQADIHHLDKAHMHLQLADIYFSMGKLEQAEASYRAAYERDPKDEDVRAHLGTCLERRRKDAEALPLLESVVATNPKHDYGYTLMTLAETQSELGQLDRALATWRQVLTMYGYPRARVQYAELCIKQKDYAEARKSLDEVVKDAPFATKFERKREKVWFNRAKSAMRSLPNS